MPVRAGKSGRQAVSTAQTIRAKPCNYPTPAPILPDFPGNTDRNTA